MESAEKPAAAAAFLVKGRPDYMTGLAHTAHLWQTWSGLTTAVRQGTGVVGDEVNERGDEWLRVFIGARGLADEHDSRARIAHPEDHVGARVAERTPMTVTDVCVELS